MEFLNFKTYFIRSEYCQRCENQEFTIMYYTIKSFHNQKPRALSKAYVLIFDSPKVLFFSIEMFTTPALFQKLLS